MSCILPNKQLCICPYLSRFGSRLSNPPWRGSAQEKPVFWWRSLSFSQQRSLRQKLLSRLLIVDIPFFLAKLSRLSPTTLRKESK